MKRFKQMKIVFLIIGFHLLLFCSCKKNDDTVTNAQIPILTTIDVSIVLPTSAISGGSISSDGGAGIIERGVCWSIQQNPTIQNNKTVDGVGSGAFTSSINNLTPSTIYYVRAYATNIAGTNYGNQVVFKTTTSTPDGTTGSITDIDGNVYSTVFIAGMEWMSENLKTTKYNDGTPIPYISNSNIWSSLTTMGFCWYQFYGYTTNDSIDYVNNYGFLYNWYVLDTSVNGNKNICPDGWHIPSASEWNTLVTYLGGANIAGGKLKEVGTTHWYSTSTLVTNESGFTALPGGYRVYNGAFFDVRNYGDYWSATTSKYDSTYASCIEFFSGNISANLNNVRKRDGFSIRCVKY